MTVDTNTLLMGETLDKLRQARRDLVDAQKAPDEESVAGIRLLLLDAIDCLDRVVVPETR